jgi:hypothetical protein
MVRDGVIVVLDVALAGVISPCLHAPTFPACFAILEEPLS